MTGTIGAGTGVVVRRLVAGTSRADSVFFVVKTVVGVGVSRADSVFFVVKTVVVKVRRQVPGVLAGVFTIVVLPETIAVTTAYVSVQAAGPRSPVQVVLVFTTAEV